MKNLKQFCSTLHVIMIVLIFLEVSSLLNAQERYYNIGICKRCNDAQENGGYGRCVGCGKNTYLTKIRAKICWDCWAKSGGLWARGCWLCNENTLGGGYARLCSECAKKDECIECGKKLGSGDIYAETDNRKIVAKYTVQITIPGKKEEFMNYFNKGAEALNNKNYEEALDHFKKCNEIIPHGMDCNIGVALRELKREEEALTYFDSAIKEEPNWGDPYGEKGITLAYLGKWNDAGPLFKKSIDLNYDSPTVYWMYGKYIQEILKKPSDAIPFYEKVIEKNPTKSYKLFIDIGSINYDLEKWDEAEKAYKAYLQFVNDDYYSLSMIGEINNKKQEYEEALTYLLRCYEIKPAHKELNYQIGLSYENLKQFDKAEEHFKKALSIDPDLAYVLKELGEMYFSQNKFEDALNYFTQCENKTPNDVRVIFMKGHCYGYLNQLDKAESNFKKALSVNPELVDVQLALADVYRFQNKLTEAIPIYQKLISSNAVDYTVNFYLSACQFYNKKYLDALESSKRYIKEDNTNNPQPYLIIALSEVKLGHYSEALLACEKALELNLNGLYEVYYNVACAYSLMNDKDKALENLKKALMTGKVIISNMEADEDLTNIKQTEEYKKLIAQYNHK
ncbi:MAG: tetratricopeptide repeat protein [Bacteroidetes bacterium]|nr:tetratricopeptide repeat protein [Bacteroidota bacterium]